MLPRIRDVHEPRDWARPWRDWPGFLLPNCPCCSTAAQLYTLGGVTSGSFPAGVPTADKTDFAAETTAAVASANLSGNRCNSGTAANPGQAGYTLGGTASLTAAGELTTADKTLFASDVTAAVATASLSQAREELAGISERTTKAYFGGGGQKIAGVLTALATADRLVFASDTTGALGSANLSLARKFPAGLTNGQTKGYWGGGFTGGTSAVVTTVDKLTFVNDTTGVQGSAALSAARLGLFAGSDGTTKGYWVGGQAGPPVGVIDKTMFATDATSAIIPTLNRSQGASGADGNKLLMMSGTTSDPSGQKFTFATESLAVVGIGNAGQLSVARQACFGFSTVGL
ncbi:MAG: hypothetical protein JSS02_18290 [Planctomycetes bacterium]|nr:hypothetical protein [Planctomycetota bacterium]